MSKTVASSETRFLYDGANPVQELNAGGTPTTNLVSGLGLDELFALVDGSGTHSLLTDALGSTLATANGSGMIEAEYTYEPFGKASQTGSGGSAYQYTGREADGTGLQFSRARYYDPAHGRFISEDPLGFGGGDINLYAYVGNSPLSFIDPLGTQAGAATIDGGINISIDWGKWAKAAKQAGIPADWAGVGRLAGWAGVGWGTGASAHKFFVSFAEAGEGSSAEEDVWPDDEEWVAEEWPNPLTPEEWAGSWGKDVLRDIKNKLGDLGTGRHGTPYIRAGNQLLRDAKDPGLLPDVRGALERLGQRWIDKGKSINHPGR